ncbi:hypothetical protein PUW24_05700 [Paenibacillus urinalis]|uniref:Lipoprotein n=1 Tax=Paenibacillus urinalis TaxID=521520 RepID=A0ABY7XB55_9BACL|nr:hypothetical protein [Paenibacillus urinalis]WDH98420.1 hypothetical protein PUW24_05700 [Paenibacillus urinalis]WDI02110.1 hypothetical protein PUW25_23425 [Paenibacillus urinalis]
MNGQNPEMTEDSRLRTNKPPKKINAQKMVTFSLLLTLPVALAGCGNNSDDCYDYNNDGYCDDNSGSSGGGAYYYGGSSGSSSSSGKSSATYKSSSSSSSKGFGSGGFFSSGG